jgi:hypothetical protein
MGALTLAVHCELLGWPGAAGVDVDEGAFWRCSSVGTGLRSWRTANSPPERARLAWGWASCAKAPRTGRASRRAVEVKRILKWCEEVGRG